MRTKLSIDILYKRSKIHNKTLSEKYITKYNRKIWCPHFQKRSKQYRTAAKQYHFHLMNIFWRNAVRQRSEQRSKQLRTKASTLYTVRTIVYERHFSKHQLRNYSSLSSVDKSVSDKTHLNCKSGLKYGCIRAISNTCRCSIVATDSAGRVIFQSEMWERDRDKMSLIFLSLIVKYSLGISVLFIFSQSIWWHKPLMTYPPFVKTWNYVIHSESVFHSCQFLGRVKGVLSPAATWSWSQLVNTNSY